MPAPLLPDLPPRQPDAPGQFAFANGERVRAIREEELRPISCLGALALFVEAFEDLVAEEKALDTIDC